MRREAGSAEERHTSGSDRRSQSGGPSHGTLGAGRRAGCARAAQDRRFGALDVDLPPKSTRVVGEQDVETRGSARDRTARLVAGRDPMVARLTRDG
jgi:hypothetical protein